MKPSKRELTLLQSIAFGRLDLKEGDTWELIKNKTAIMCAVDSLLCEDNFNRLCEGYLQEGTYFLGRNP